MHDYIKELGLGYTFIDVGGWYERSDLHPLPTVLIIAFRSESIAAYAGQSVTAYVDLVKAMTSANWGTGDVKTAITDRNDIGQYVARILADSRTLNRYVFVWAEEVTLNEVIALAEKVLGKKLELPNVSGEELNRRAGNAEGLLVYALQYVQSMWIRGDNTVANAKRPEYGSALDAQKLYPDYKPRKLESLMYESTARRQESQEFRQ